jgi:hypothetical protein
MNRGVYIVVDKLKIISWQAAVIFVSQCFKHPNMVMDKLEFCFFNNFFLWKGIKTCCLSILNICEFMKAHMINVPVFYHIC